MTVVTVNKDGLFFTAPYATGNFSQGPSSGYYVHPDYIVEWSGTNLHYTSGYATPTSGTLTLLKASKPDAELLWSITTSYQIKSTDASIYSDGLLWSIVASGSESWVGGLNDDTFWAAAGGYDTYDGAGGTDTLKFGYDYSVFTFSGLSLSNESFTLSAGTEMKSGVWIELFEFPNETLTFAQLYARVTGLAAPLTGTESADNLIGTAGTDNLMGLGGNDTLKGLGGNDYLDGGSGLDTALYSGAKGGYAIGSTAQTLTVNGPEGLDTLVNVERLKFTDVSVAFDVDGTAGQAYRLYQAALNRTPDVPGLGFQMKALDDGWAITAVAQNFIDSPEFNATYGALNDAQFVTQLYANVLHRAPDAGGLAYHVERLQTVPRSYVLVGFSESPENQAAVIGVIENGMVYTV